VPDTRGRVLAGYDPSNTTGRLTDSTSQGVSAATVGNVGGEQAHTLIVGELTAHSHGINDPTHTHGINDPTHAHSVNDPTHYHGTTNGGLFLASGTTFNYQTVGGGAIDTIPVTQNSATGISIYASATGISTAAAGTGISTQATGSSAGHNNIQPSLIVGWIIKT
jgi:microcystin-dependent protein